MKFSMIGQENVTFSLNTGDCLLDLEVIAWAGLTVFGKWKFFNIKLNRH